MDVSESSGGHRLTPSVLYTGILQFAPFCPFLGLAQVTTAKKSQAIVVRELGFGAAGGANLQRLPGYPNSQP